MLKSKSATAAWLDTISLIKTNGRQISPRGQPTMELLHHSICVDMTRPVLAVKERKLSYEFLAAEAIWITCGGDKVIDIAPWNKNIANYSDDGETFFGAYGPKIAAQFDYVIGKLLDDGDTRQAVLTIWRENPPQTKDYPCTIAMAFQIRGSMLHSHVFMRSSDVWLGLPYDMFNFSMVALKVLCEVNRLRKMRDGAHKMLVPGELYLTMASSHLYMQNYEQAQALEQVCTVSPSQTLPVEPAVDGRWSYYMQSMHHCRAKEFVSNDSGLWRIRP